MTTFNITMNITISILTGLAAAIPLVVKLVQTIQAYVKAKNWTPLMQLTMQLMTTAEKDYDKGEDKKKFVMNQIEQMKDSLNYEVDMDVVSNMIDSICQASRKINVKKK